MNWTYKEKSSDDLIYGKKISVKGFSYYCFNKKNNEGQPKHEKPRIKVRYLHSNIDTLEIETIKDLRTGTFDVLVRTINLLRNFRHTRN